MLNEKQLDIINKVENMEQTSLLKPRLRFSKMVADGLVSCLAMSFGPLLIAFIRSFYFMNEL